MGDGLPEAPFCTFCSCAYENKWITFVSHRALFAHYRDRHQAKVIGGTLTVQDTPMCEFAEALEDMGKLING